MGKGLILENLGEGKYRVEILRDTTRLDAKIAGNDRETAKLTEEKGVAEDRYRQAVNIVKEAVAKFNADVLAARVPYEAAQAALKTAEDNLERIGAEIDALEAEKNQIETNIQRERTEIEYLSGEIARLTRFLDTPGLSETDKANAQSQIASYETLKHEREYTVTLLSQSATAKDAAITTKETERNTAYKAKTDAEKAISDASKTLAAAVEKADSGVRYAESLRDDRHAELALIKARLTAAKLAAKELEKSKPPKKIVEIWCANQSDRMSGTVGIIDCSRIIGWPDSHNPADHMAIRPGGQWDKTDGVEQPIASSTPAAAFFNAALMPAMYKWRPQYRMAIVKAVYPERETCDVMFDQYNARKLGSGDRTPMIINRLSESGSEMLFDVPWNVLDVDFVHLDVGDTVAIHFKNRIFFDPEVVGWIGPKDISECRFGDPIDLGPAAELIQKLYVGAGLYLPEIDHKNFWYAVFPWGEFVETVLMAKTGTMDSITRIFRVTGLSDEGSVKAVDIELPESFTYASNADAVGGLPSRALVQSRIGETLYIARTTYNPGYTSASNRYSVAVKVVRVGGDGAIVDEISEEFECHRPGEYGGRYAPGLRKILTQYGPAWMRVSPDRKKIEIIGVDGLNVTSIAEAEDGKDLFLGLFNTFHSRRYVGDIDGPQKAYEITAYSVSPIDGSIAEAWNDIRVFTAYRTANATVPPEPGQPFDVWTNYATVDEIVNSLYVPDVTGYATQEELFFVAPVPFYHPSIKVYPSHKGCIIKEFPGTDLVGRYAVYLNPDLDYVITAGPEYLGAWVSAVEYNGDTGQWTVLDEAYIGASVHAVLSCGAIVASSGLWQVAHGKVEKVEAQTFIGPLYGGMSDPGADAKGPVMLGNFMAGESVRIGSFLALYANRWGQPSYAGHSGLLWPEHVASIGEYTAALFGLSHDWPTRISYNYQVPGARFSVYKSKTFGK